MFDLAGIMGLAKYEGRLLRRTWKFWILAVLVSIVLSVNQDLPGRHRRFPLQFLGQHGRLLLAGEHLPEHVPLLQHPLRHPAHLVLLRFHLAGPAGPGGRGAALPPPEHLQPGLGKFFGTFNPVAFIAIVLIPLATLFFYLVAAILHSFFPFLVFRTYFPVTPYLVQVFVITLPSLAFIIALVFFLATVTKSRVAAIIIAHAYVLIDMVAFLLSATGCASSTCPSSISAGTVSSPSTPTSPGFPICTWCCCTAATSSA